MGGRARSQAGWPQADAARPASLAKRRINTTDPDTRLLKRAGGRSVQGYNAQVVASPEQVTVAADITQQSNDSGQLRQGPEAQRIEAVLSKPEGQALYRRRQQIVEPVFANTKFIRRADRFLRRGLAGCQAEWRLIAATLNLLNSGGRDSRVP